MSVTILVVVTTVSLRFNKYLQSIVYTVHMNTSTMKNYVETIVLGAQAGQLSTCVVSSKWCAWPAV